LSPGSPDPFASRRDGGSGTASAEAGFPLRLPLVGETAVGETAVAPRLPLVGETAVAPRLPLAGSGGAGAVAVVVVLAGAVLPAAPGPAPGGPATPRLVPMPSACGSASSPDWGAGARRLVASGRLPSEHWGALLFKRPLSAPPSPGLPCWTGPAWPPPKPANGERSATRAVKVSTVDGGSGGGRGEKLVPSNSCRGSSSSTWRLHMRHDPYLPQERRQGPMSGVAWVLQAGPSCTGDKPQGSATERSRVPTLLESPRRARFCRTSGAAPVQSLPYLAQRNSRP
jgi:hypothetical protein